MYTKLQLVNACLVATGISTVPTLDNPDVDTDTAIMTVDSALIAVLKKGWWFNTEHKWLLTPSTQGEIDIPKGALKILQKDGYTDDLVMRKGKLYSKTKHTFNMRGMYPNGIELSFVLWLDIEDIPVSAQQYIRQKAITDTLAQPDGDNDKLTVSQGREFEYMTELQREDVQHTEFNSRKFGSLQAIEAAMFGGFSNPLGGYDD